MSIAFSPDSQKIATVDFNGTTKIWNLEGQIIKTLKSLGGRGLIRPTASFVAGSNKVLTTGGKNGIARLWDISNNQIVDLAGHSGFSSYSYSGLELPLDVLSMLEVTASSDGNTLATGGLDEAWLWNSEGKVITKFRDVNPMIGNMAFSPDNLVFFVGGSDNNSAKLWYLTEHMLAQLKNVNPALSDYEPHQKTFAFPGLDGSVTLLDSSGKQLTKFLTSHKGLFQVLFSPDGKNLVTVGNRKPSGDGVVRLWTLSGKLIASLRGARGEILGVRLHPSNKAIATFEERGIIQLWDTSGKHLIKLEKHQGDVLEMDFTPDGKFFFTLGMDGVAWVWNERGKSLTQLIGHRGKITALTLSPDGNLILTKGEDGSARLWSITGKQITQLQNYQPSSGDMYFSPNSKILARVNDAINQVNADGIRLSTLVKGGTVQLWDTSGQTIAKLEGHQGYIYGIAFSPDSKNIATWSSDSTARLWDTSSGQQITVFKGHQGRIESAGYSPDGKVFGTIGQDHTTRFWDLSGRQIAQFYDQGTVSPDGQRIFLIPKNGNELNGKMVLRMFELDTSIESLLQRSCDRVKYYLLASPELKDDRKMCGLE